LFKLKGSSISENILFNQKISAESLLCVAVFIKKRKCLEQKIVVINNARGSLFDN